jgi:hypothetical protein
MARPPGKEAQVRKGLRKLNDAVKQALREAAENYPDNPELIEEWVKWTHMIVMELVKRKDTTFSTMLRNAKRVVRRRMERTRCDAILQMKFDPISGPTTSQNKHVDSKEHDIDPPEEPSPNHSPPDLPNPEQRDAEREPK